MVECVIKKNFIGAEKMYRMIKKTINVEDIYQPDVVRTYDPERLGIIKKSIEDNGWIPNFGHLPYHGDNLRFSYPFFLRENPETGKFHSPNASHRIKVLQELEYKTVEAYIACYTFKNKHSEEYVSNQVKAITKELQQNQKGMFQSFGFDYDIKLNSRDDSKGIFNSTEWSYPYYVEKNVLDIACNGGYFALEAKRNGANKVIAFDHDSYMIDKANQFKDLLDLDVNFSVQNFWNFDWSQKFDIVFCGQCIYHFGNDNKALEALDLICNATTNNLVMFTFVDMKNPDLEDFSTGYRAGYRRFWQDLKQRGFREVLLFHHRGGKSTVVASKQPWKYLYLENKIDHLTYYNSTIKNKIDTWHKLSETELIDLWD